MAIVSTNHCQASMSALGKFWLRFLLNCASNLLMALADTKQLEVVQKPGWYSS